jgi:putative transposase
MSRYRLYPTPAQEELLAEHCAHARFVWNLACEQQSWWWPGRGRVPGYLEQARQLTEARTGFAWLRAGSQMVQQQALRDFAQAMANFFAGTHGHPTWRKAGRDEGFRIVAVRAEQVRRLSRKTGEVWIPKAGWGLLVRRLKDKAPDGWRRSVPRTSRSGAVRAGRWTGSHARAKPSSGAPPADTRVTRT